MSRLPAESELDVLLLVELELDDVVLAADELESALDVDPKSDCRSFATEVAAVFAVVVSPDCTADSRLARSFMKVETVSDVSACVCCVAVVSLDRRSAASDDKSALIWIRPEAESLLSVRL